MDPRLRNRLAAAGASVLMLAGVLVEWHEPAPGAAYFKPYRDTGGIWTVCDGHTGNVDPNRTYTQAECDAFRTLDLEVAQAGVRRQIKVELNPWQEAALVDFVFNLGEPALASSTMKAKFNTLDYVGGCTELAKWVKGRVRGQLVTLPGLVTRRANEEELCLNGV